MNLSQLEVFAAIVDTGTLTEAAEVVGLTQSAVSYSLRKLEAELGVTLLERGRGGITLTRIGADVLHHARAMLNGAETIRQVTARERGLTVGKVRFGCVPTIPPRLLTGIIRDFQHRYPDIELIVFEGSPPELVDWLANGVIDVGTVAAPDGYALASPLIHDEIKILVSGDHRLAGQAAASSEEISTESLIGAKAEYGILNRVFRQRGITVPHLRHEVSTPSAIIAMVRENLGITMVLKMLNPPDLDGLHSLSIAPPVFVDIYIASNGTAPAIQAFVSSTTNWAKEHGFLAADP